MKRLIYVFALALFFLAPSPGIAQTQSVADAIRRLPSEGKTENDFVPRGWEIRDQATGDLNGDRISDVVLTLALPFEAVDPLKEIPSDSAPNILVVLFGHAGGRLSRFAVNGQLYPADADSRSSLTPTIKDGILSVNDNWGDGWAKDITYKFRYDRSIGKLMLIGFDSEVYSRMDPDSGQKSSENYLTGVRVAYSKGARRRGDGYTETDRGKIRQAKITFEAARYFEEEGGQMRPY